ncbi:unnamed protein product [Larinioides sclopetarius]|uniref:GIY-YIG domain-containing protein n=1 Tax=Larinioides sclopetarius TaxID=280406 RepID=A0AAV1Z289_9ARAC
MKIDKMVLTEDSRPFTVLRKGAEDFRSLFNEGIETCLSTLDSGISDLLCDPDSLVGSATSANRLSAHMEFSKAKYELFVKMREFFEKFEKDCVEQISEMKEMFLENVEIFLAGTKLEVKLPTSETLSEIEKRRSPGSKVRSGSSPTASPASSLYPKLIDSAKKHISPVFTPVRENGKSPKRVTIVTPQEMEILEAARKGMDGSAIIDISEDSDEEPAVLEVASKRTGRNQAVSTPASQKKIPARTPTRRNPAVKETSSDSGSDSKSANTPLRRRNAKTVEKEVNESISVDQKDTEDSLPQVEIKSRRATRSQLSTPTVSTPVSTPGRKTKTPRRKANVSEDSQQAEAGHKTPKSVHFSSDIESNEDSAIQKSPKDMHFSVGMDIHEDLDVYSPEVKLTRTTPRRKTAVLSQVIPEIDLTQSTSRGKSKRKTIAGSNLDETVAPSPKRLKMGRRSNIMPSTSGEEDEPMVSNSLASDGASERDHYSSWMPLSDISGSVPPQPGIYELKVSAAKKPAYIGGCDNLRQKLTLHKLKQNSGHKHLDKFVDRNLSSILVRYEQLSSVTEAKSEEKIRVKAFVDRFKTSPAYN